MVADIKIKKLEWNDYLVGFIATLNDGRKVQYQYDWENYYRQGWYPNYDTVNDYDDKHTVTDVEEKYLRSVCLDTEDPAGAVMMKVAGHLDDKYPDGTNCDEYGFFDGCTIDLDEVYEF